MPQVDHTAEVEEAINAALQRSGMAGHVVIHGTTAELHGGDTVVAIELGDWGKQWPLLPPDIRARKVNDAARRLRAAASGKAGRRSGAADRQTTARLKQAAMVVVVLVLLGAGIHWLRQSNFFGQVDGSASRDEPAGEGGAPATAATLDRSGESAREVCDVARKRILSSGSFTGFDVTGWEVAVWLARQPADAEWAEALAKRVDDGELTKEARSALGMRDEASLRRVEGDHARAVKLAPESVVLRLEGALVAAFFDPKSRSDLVELVAGWAVKEKAQHAALYGTCAHLDVADVGAWYGGKDRAAAVTSLSLVSGLLTAAPALDAAELAGEGDTLSRLVTWSHGLVDEKVDDAIRSVGGTVSESWSGAPADGGAAGAGASIRFPLGGPLRAAKAVRKLARTGARPSDQK
ncbi:MAG: hypothetical protein JRI23_10435 [Deltaproteobacteria bacterium]|nr:hypothetical protein [Deltaproteobacteria bacterium]MBW2532088.1 hypothetical protein [Deltaproteobacteria bacterium]